MSERNPDSGKRTDSALRALAPDVTTADFFGCNRCSMYTHRDAKWEMSQQPVATNVCPNCLQLWDFTPAEPFARRARG